MWTVEGRDLKTICFKLLPLHTHIRNLKGVFKIFFELWHMKGNLYWKNSTRDARTSKPGEIVFNTMRYRMKQYNDLDT